MLLLRHLLNEGYDVQSEIVQTAADMKTALAEGDWDIVLSDYTMPHFTGLDALRVLQKSGQDIPLIIISGTIGEDIAVEAMLKGANDYLMKGNLTRLVPAIERDLESAARRLKQKQAENALRRSEENLANAQRIAHIGSWETNLVNNHVFWSDEVYRIYGLSKDHLEISLEVFISFIHPDDRQSVQGAADEAVLQKAPYNTEHRIIRPDGDVRIVCEIGEVTFDETGEPLRFIGTVQDVTERKVTEEEKMLLSAQIEQQHERLNNIVDNVEGVVWETWRKPDEAAQKIDFISDYVETMLGYTVEEWLSTPKFWLSIVHPDDRERMKRVACENSLKSQSFIEEFRWVAKDGHIVWVETHSTAICDDQGQAIGYRGVNIDITERKQAERMIIESEERYRFLFDNSPLPMWVFDLETLDFLSVNKAAISHYGYSRKEFLSMSLKDIRLPEDIPVLLESVKRDVDEVTKVGVLKHRKKDGTIIFADIISNQLIFDGRKAKLVLVNDVTERRKAEESVRFQAHLLNTVEQSVVATDLNGIVTYWNQFAEKLYGWTSAEAVGCSVLKLTTPEINRQQGNQTIARLRAGKGWAGEFVVQNKAGDNFPAYTSNSPVTDKAGKVIGFVGVSVDIIERKNAETALREAQGKYRRLIESSPGIIYLNEPNPPYSTIFVSPGVEILGYSIEEWYAAPGMWANLLHKDDFDRVLREFKYATEHDLETDLEYRVLGRDGTVYWWQDRGRFVSDVQGNKLSWQGIILDITKTKALEDQLRQSQKLESVGLLAGGIAHDFNNMLTAINGYSDLTLRKLGADDPLRRNIEEIKKAGVRSADLTHQLLAFSRQQILQPIVLDLNEIIRDTMKMLNRLIGEDIQLATIFNPKIGLVKVDPGQLSQLIMNLAVNARDAMPRGGKITIETANVFLDPNYVREHIGVLPGAYVMLAVSDTGSGMSAEVKEHIFEPFFTTKEIGKGTGLGLATVYGIVKQSGGNIEFKSEESAGTTFKVYLPRVAQQTVTVEKNEISLELPKGTETILVVEDEEMVRHLTRQILEECGYTVIEARNGIEALEICEQKDYKFDLLMTDVVMPEMGGSELSEVLKTKLSDLKTLFTSGYTDDAVVRHGVIEAGTNFLHKPYTPEALANKIREILDDTHKT